MEVLGFFPVVFSSLPYPTFFLKFFNINVILLVNGVKKWINFYRSVSLGNDGKFWFWEKLWHYSQYTVIIWNPKYILSYGLMLI